MFFLIFLKIAGKRLFFSISLPIFTTIIILFSELYFKIFQYHCVKTGSFQMNCHNKYIHEQYPYSDRISTGKMITENSNLHGI